MSGRLCNPKVCRHPEQGVADREDLAAKARSLRQGVETEGGPLCHVCAAVMAADSEYLWLGLTTAPCYNCGGSNVEEVL